MEENREQLIRRVREMETLFDAVRLKWETNPQGFRANKIAQEQLALLLAYYEGGQWLKDYELDAKGLLPAEVKRGILSEDGFYNFLTEIEPL